MRKFMKWFGTKGIKRYGLALLIAIAIDIGFIVDYAGIWTDGGTGASTGHIIMVVLAHLALIGFHIGLFFHIRDAYRKS